VGDVTDRLQLTPVAIHEAMCFVETAFKDNPTRPDHIHVPSAVFTTPELGAVGLTEAKALAKGHAIDVYKSTFKPLLHTLAGVLSHPDEADRGRQNRQGVGLPYLRRPCRRDHPDRGGVPENGGDQDGF
jgi:hypothetical protein